MANQHKKEMGIRKVRSARGLLVVWIGSASMLLLVLLSIIAPSLGWTLSSLWLKVFVFKVSLNSWLFGFCAAGILFVGLFVLAVRSWVAARDNPIENIKAE